MELKTAMIDGLEYKVVLKGEKKFAYFKPVDDWLGSTMPVWKIEQAIKDAKKPRKESGEPEHSKPPTQKVAGVKAPKSGHVRTPMKPELILSALADGEKTMSQLEKRTKRGPTAIKTALRFLVGKVSSRKIPRDGAYSSEHKVTVWELVA